MVQNNTQMKEYQTLANRVSGYPGRALSAILATAMVRLVLLSSLVRCSLAVRLEKK